MLHILNNSPTLTLQEEGHVQYPLTAQSSTDSTNEMAAVYSQQQQQQQQQQQLNNQIILQHQMGAGQVIPNAVCKLNSSLIKYSLLNLELNVKKTD